MSSQTKISAPLKELSLDQIEKALTEALNVTFKIQEDKGFLIISGLDPPRLIPLVDGLTLKDLMSYLTP
jgi:hypothetical protein